MTTRKARKPLADSLANQFVYGAPQGTDQSLEPEPTADPVPKVLTSPEVQSQEPKSVMEKLMQATEKEPTVRLTVDLSESMHRKLSILAARTGKKKVEIVRMLLDEVLQQVND